MWLASLQKVHPLRRPFNALLLCGVMKDYVPRLYRPNQRIRTFGVSLIISLRTVSITANIFPVRDFHPIPFFVHFVPPIAHMQWFQSVLGEMITEMRTAFREDFRESG